MTYGSFDFSILIIVLATLIPAIAGIGLWMFAERICRVNAQSVDIEIRSSLEALDLVSIGTLLLGLYAVFYGVVGALNSESMIWAQAMTLRDTPAEIARFSTSHVPMRVSYVAQLALGLVLIFGRQRIASLLLKARYAGTGRT